MLLAGVPTYYRSFSSPMQVNETARMLATNSRLFQRVVAVRNKMILSGLHAGWHWAAEIDAFGSGARGMVSAVPMRLARSDAGPEHDVADRLDWLPGGDVMNFDQQLRREEGWAMQRIYSVALPPSEVRDRKSTRLNSSH